ncbi:MAG: hypothetical protein JO069_17905 [Verrucomicrobia bacterium]|nr:hypothetical protein [Verrucomicrobiota bacterium]
MAKRAVYKDRLVTVTDSSVAVGHDVVALRDLQMATVVTREPSPVAPLVLLLLVGGAWCYNGGTAAAEVAHLIGMLVLVLAFARYVWRRRHSAELQLRTKTRWLTVLPEQSRHYVETVCGHILLASAKAKAELPGDEPHRPTSAPSQPRAA